jgi:SAM-dependent methyltransferase
MLTSMYYLQDGVTRLRKIDSQIKETTDVEQFKSRLYSICYDMASAAEECYFAFDNSGYKEIKDAVLKAVSDVNHVNDATEFRRILQSILIHFPEGYDFRTPSIGDFSSHAYSAAMTYKPLDELGIKAICDVVNTHNRPITILDPLCKDGFNLAAFKKYIPNAVTYGLEAEETMASQAKTKIDRLAKGPLAGSKISNDVFDMLFLQPNVAWNFTVLNGVFSKAEKTWLQNVLKYLRPGGTFVYVIPHYRMYKDVCLHIAKYVDNIQIRKLAGRDFSDRGLIAIIGQRTLSKEVNEENYRTLRRLYNSEEIPYTSSTLDPIRMQQHQLNVEVFRGSILDMDEMQNIVNTSGCLNSFWEGQNVEKLSENQKRPLLPFNIGQIGLVLTSGCLDGTIEEGDGNYHVIKGRVSKQSTSSTGTVDGAIEINETIGNRVEINVIMPNGEYKVLA